MCAIAAMKIKRSRRASSRMCVDDKPMPKSPFLVSRNVSSIVKRLPYHLMISGAFLSLRLVAMHHASFIFLSCTSTTAGTT